MYETQAQLTDAYLATGQAAEARVIAEDLVAREPWERAHIERFRRALVMLQGLGSRHADRRAAQRPGAVHGDGSFRRSARRDPAVDASGRAPPADLAAEPSTRSAPAASRSARTPRPGKPADEVEIDLTTMLGDLEGRAAMTPPDPEDLERSRSTTSVPPSPGRTDRTRPAQHLEARADLPRDGHVRRGHRRRSRPRRGRPGIASRPRRCSPGFYRNQQDLAARHRVARARGRSAGTRAPRPDGRCCTTSARRSSRPGETARALAVFLELQADAGDYRDVAARVHRLSPGPDGRLIIRTVSRLLFAAYFLEAGFILVVAPWSAFWEHNRFAASHATVEALDQQPVRSRRRQRHRRHHRDRGPVGALSGDPRPPAGAGRSDPGRTVTRWLEPAPGSLLRHRSHAAAGSVGAGSARSHPRGRAGRRRRRADPRARPDGSRTDGSGPRGRADGRVRAACRFWSTIGSTSRSPPGPRACISRSDSIRPDRVRAMVPAGFVIGCSVHSAGGRGSRGGGGRLLTICSLAPCIRPRASRIRRPAGQTALADVCRRVALPVLAIGGVDESNAAEVAAAGAAGLAAIGAFIAPRSGGSRRAPARDDTRNSTMEPGLRSPLIDFFRRGEVARDVKLLAAQGGVRARGRTNSSRCSSCCPTIPIRRLRRRPNPRSPRCRLGPLTGFLARLGRAERDARVFRGARRSAGGGRGGRCRRAARRYVDRGSGRAGDPQRRSEEPRLLSSLPVLQRMKLAMKGTREQRAMLVRDSNRLVAVSRAEQPEAHRKRSRGVHEDGERLRGRAARHWHQPQLVEELRCRGGLVPQSEDAAGDRDAADSPAQRARSENALDRPQRPGGVERAGAEDPHQRQSSASVALSCRHSLRSCREPFHVHDRLAALLLGLQRLQQIDRAIEVALNRGGLASRKYSRRISAISFTWPSGHGAGARGPLRRLDVFSTASGVSQARRATSVPHRSWPNARGRVGVGADHDCRARAARLPRQVLGQIPAVRLAVDLERDAGGRPPRRSPGPIAPRPAPA